MKNALVTKIFHLLANLVHTNNLEKAGKLMKLWHMSTHLIVLSKGFPMNTNMTGQNRTLPLCSLGKSNLII